MKKFGGLFLIFFCLSLKSFALEDYILLSKVPVKKVTSSNKEVIIAHILTTIMNEKNTLIIKSIGKGKAVLTFTIEDEVFDVAVNVKDNKTVFKNKNTNFEFIKIDLPPESFEIDLPPNIGGGK